MPHDQYRTIITYFGLVRLEVVAVSGDWGYIFFYCPKLGCSNSSMIS